MHPTYQTRLRTLTEETGKSLAAAKTEIDINVAQNKFNDTLNQIKADARAQPDGPPQRQKPADTKTAATATSKPAEPGAGSSAAG